MTEHREHQRRAPLGRNYWKLWSASVISNLGDGLATVAYPWIASTVTRNPLHLAGIAVATRLPWAVFTLPAGVIADRVDRRKLVGWSDAFRFAVTLAVALVVLAGGDSFPDPAAFASGEADAPPRATLYLVVIYASALVFGMAEVLRDNAAQTMMPSVVGPDQLERANGRLWGAELVMNSFVGPPLAGVLIALLLALPLLVDAATFAISAVLILSMAGDFRTRRGRESARQRIAWMAEIKEGVTWLWQHRLLRSLAVILGLLNALITMSMATYVFFVQEILDLDASRFGLLMTAGALGGVIGSVAAPKVSERLGPGTSLFASIAFMTLQSLVTGATSSAVVVWAMFFIGTFWAVVWNVITVSLRQQIIPDELLGRVNSVYRFFAWGMMPIGSLLGGVIVATTEVIAGRELALRMPFYVSGVVLVGIFIAALSRVNTGAIEDARTGAQVSSVDVEASGAADSISAPAETFPAADPVADRAADPGVEPPSEPDSGPSSMGD
jgi:MFS family permease